MSRIIGIDLGTTNSEVALVENGRPRLLGVGDERILPSVVGVGPRGEILVGQAARNQYVARPQDTVRSIKRQMGTDETVTLGQRSYRPQEISALVLGDLKRRAEAHLGAPVTRAVITVPAWFNERQRRATVEAGELAGLEVARIVNEPTACALAYGLGREGDMRVLVYDLGGGTFDVSVVEMCDGVTEVRASHGDVHLGGDDVDRLLVDELARRFEAKHRVDLRRDAQSAARLWRAAEAAKMALSSLTVVSVAEEHIARRGKQSLHLEEVVTREELETLALPLLERTLESVRIALREAGMEARDVDRVLLAGGATRMPLVSRLLEERLGLVPRMEVHPDECVALGAAVQAGLLDGVDLDAVLVDVTSHTLGIAIVEWAADSLVDDVFAPMIRRNTVVPVSFARDFEPVFAGQRGAEIHVYQGERARASENVLLGSFKVEFPPQLDDEHDPIHVLFDLDASGLLSVSATHRRSGSREAISVHADRPGGAAGMRTAESEQVIPVDPDLAAARDGLRALLRQAEKVLSDLPLGADASTCEALGQAVKAAEVALGLGDVAAARSAEETLVDALADAALVF